MGRILKFNSDKADEQITALKSQIETVKEHLAHIIDYTIDWYTRLKEKYGKRYPRLTVIRGFDTIEATKVVEANEKLYINREEGFIGPGLKKEEFVCTCSDIDDIIIFYRDGRVLLAIKNMILRRGDLGAVLYGFLPIRMVKLKF